MDIGFDHAAAGDVFLHDTIDPVQTLLHHRKQRRYLENNENDQSQDDGKGAGHDDAEAQIQAQHTEDTAHKEHQVADEAADQLTDQVLQLGDVVGDAGDQRTGGKTIRLAEGQAHNFFEHVLAQVIGEILAGHIGEHAAHDAEKSAQYDGQDHADAGADDQVQVANAAIGQAQDALIHDGAHESGL